MRDNPYWALLSVFVPFSLISFGGGGSIFAGIQHQSVDVHHWVTAREFVNLFAISRGAPGPGSMLSTLIGWKVAGWGGALAATLGLFLPSSLLCYGVAHVWNRHRGKRWHTALERGLAPIGAGLLLAGVVSIVRIAETGIPGFVLAGASALAITILPRINPLILLAIGALLFVTFVKHS
ncbi:chromate transporter [Microvirga antarctica]|uniref:chromate transporter n=1 Tax=Microvirga antarctica TaxID=2819233 RepID=UPI001B30C569|nr:chromate transporter [Microvirga antarctica]